MPLPSWTPDIATLDLLASVAELGSVGRAAALHGISQPSASARLDRLETELGTTLLVRTSRGSSLTANGEAVVAWAKDVLDAARTLTDGVATLRGDQRARLRVAASLTVAEYLLPHWLLLLRRAHAGVDIAAHVANSAEVADAVRRGQADVGFVETPDPPAGLRHERVATDRLALVVAPDYPLAAKAGRVIDARELIDQPVLLREPGSGTRDTFLHALATRLGNGVARPAHALELGSTATIVAAALEGGGIGVVSARAVASLLADGRLVELSAPDLDLERPLRAVWTARVLDPLPRELVTIARRSLQA